MLFIVIYLFWCQFSHFVHFWVIFMYIYSFLRRGVITLYGQWDVSCRTFYHTDVYFTNFMSNVVISTLFSCFAVTLIYFNTYVVMYNPIKVLNHVLCVNTQKRRMAMQYYENKRGIVFYEIKSVSQRALLLVNTITHCFF